MMKKSFISIAIFLGLFLVSTISFSKELTDYERRIYYELIENAYDEGINDISEAESDRKVKEIGNKYGVSLDKLHYIAEVGMYREPTGQEWQMYDEVWEKLDSLPEESIGEEKERIYREIADKYSVEVVELYDVIIRGALFEDW